MGCCHGSFCERDNISLADEKIINKLDPGEQTPPTQSRLQQSLDLESQLGLQKDLKESVSFGSSLTFNPFGQISGLSNGLAVGQAGVVNMKKSISLFGGIVKEAACKVQEQVDSEEINRQLKKSLTIAQQALDEHANKLGEAIKDGYEQSAAMVQAQIALVKEGLDDAIKAVKDLKLQKRLNDIVYPVLKKVFVHSVTCDIDLKYEVLEILGRGSHSTVRKVVEKSSGLERAAKIIIKNTLNEHQTQNLISEIETLKVLDHPNIVRVIEIVEEVTKLCIITEVCVGGELFDRIVKTEGFDEVMASQIMYQVLSGLIHIHGKGFIHRDLKPENLLFADKDTDVIKIIDFGITKVGNELLRKKSSCVGSSYYLSPEAINGNYDFKSDVWSCGVILYLLLCGKPPFTGKSEQEIFTKISRGVFKFSDRKWKNISKEAKELIQKMLNKDLSTRFSAAEAFDHPWIQNSINRTLQTFVISPIVLKNLSLFRANTRLQQATLSFIASNMLSGHEIKELRDAFIVLDTNGDGQLTELELRRGFNNITLSSCVKLEDILRACDMDMNGMIDYTEFLTATLDWQKHLSQDILQKAFSVFDTDKSGSISIREIKQFLGVEDDNPDDVWSEILKEADENGDGEIDMEEFTKLMLSKFAVN